MNKAKRKQTVTTTTTQVKPMHVDAGTKKSGSGRVKQSVLSDIAVCETNLKTINDRVASNWDKMPQESQEDIKNDLQTLQSLLKSMEARSQRTQKSTKQGPAKQELTSASRSKVTLGKEKDKDCEGSKRQELISSIFEYQDALVEAEASGRKCPKWWKPETLVSLSQQDDTNLESLCSGLQHDLKKHTLILEILEWQAKAVEKKIVPSGESYTPYTYDQLAKGHDFQVLECIKNCFEDSCKDKNEDQNFQVIQAMQGKFANQQPRSTVPMKMLGVFFVIFMAYFLTVS